MLYFFMYSKKKFAKKLFQIALLRSKSQETLADSSNPAYLSYSKIKYIDSIIFRIDKQQGPTV